jgi:hypothetical protein
VLMSKNMGLIWVPPNEELQREIIFAHHDGWIAGHLGMEGTLEMVTQKFWWNQIADFVKCYVQGCHTCARNKHQNKRPVGLLQPLPVPEGPWLWTNLTSSHNCHPQKVMMPYMLSQIIWPRWHILYHASPHVLQNNLLNYTFITYGLYMGFHCITTPIGVHSSQHPTCMNYTRIMELINDYLQLITLKPKDK